LTATPENDLASEFIASRFERLGLKRMGTDGSYFQRFHLSTATLGQSNSLVVSSMSVKRTLPVGQEFVRDFSVISTDAGGSSKLFWA
jgi:hypothetical protein